MARLTILAKIELPEGWTLAPYPGDPSGELFLVIDGKYHSPTVSWLCWNEAKQAPDGSLELMCGADAPDLDDPFSNATTEYHAILEKG